MVLLYRYLYIQCMILVDSANLQAQTPPLPAVLWFDWTCYWGIDRVSIYYELLTKSDCLYYEVD